MVRLFLWLAQRSAALWLQKFCHNVSVAWIHCWRSSWACETVAQPAQKFCRGQQIWEVKMLDFRQITLFYLGCCLSKHKMTICSKNRVGAVTGKLPATTLLYRKQACWKTHNPKNSQDKFKRVTTNQNSLVSQLILKTTSFKRQQSHKTSHKTLAKSHDAWSRLGEPPSTKIYLKVLEVFKSANHQTIPQATANWNTWRKWEFPSHMTIYGYKYRLIWTEIQS